MTSLKVALAGATGLLGKPLVSALLHAQQPILILTRQDSTSTSSLPQSPLITVKEVDYKSINSLKAALQGMDVVISTLAAVGLGDQLNLVNAAHDAGVKRFIPSEFGSDTSNPNNVNLPVYGGKIASANRLKELASQTPEFTWTLVYNQLFFDSGLTSGFIINPAKHTATVYDGGDCSISVTRLSTVAKAVTNLLNHLEETKNRIVYIHDTVTSQNKLIQLFKDVDGKEWDVTSVDSAQLRKDSFEELKNDNPDFGKAMVGFLPGAIYGKGAGGDFTGKTDNELLGIGEMSEDEVRGLVREVLGEVSGK